VCLCALPAFASAQSERQGVLPDATFDTTFRKYTPPDNKFSPFYSWDAVMALDVTVFRRSLGAVTFTGIMQAIGTENLGPHVSVGGTGYILSAGYVHPSSPDLKISAGMTHLSSHLTRDLDDKLAEQRNSGMTIPVVKDPDQYNVFYFRISRRFPAVRLLQPELEIAIEPITFRFWSAPKGNTRPLFVASHWTLWHGDRKALTAGTQHEIGKNAFNRFSVALELYGRNGSEGRLQLFVTGSPGNELHVSPNVGAFRDGISLGARVKFRE
jgi:hypothetical protein